MSDDVENADVTDLSERVPSPSREDARDDPRIADDLDADASAAAEMDDEQFEPDSEAALTSPVAAELASNRFESTLIGTGYSPIRALFKRNPERYYRLQRRLNQARISLTYDQYLARCVRPAVLAGVVGLLFGIVIDLLVLDAVQVTVPAPNLARLVPLATRNLLEVVGIPVAIATTAATATWLWLTRFRPRQLVASRRREINLVLPHTVTFMYALTDAGSDLLVAIQTVADAQDVYGETALEFDRVVREMELFGNDLQTALRNTAQLSPSDEFQNFVDDLLSVLSAGGEVDRFLGEEVDDRLETAVEEQEAYVETLALLSEAFVVGFVAAPLFIIVTLTVVSFLGAETLRPLGAVVYVVFPVGIVAFVVLIDLISAPFVQPPVDLDVEQTPAWATGASELKNDSRFRAFRRNAWRRQVREIVSQGADRVRENPLLSLIVSVPAGIAIAVAAGLTGVAEPSVAGLLADPFGVTVAFAVVPALVAAIPVSLLHERRTRQRRRLIDRFPDLLELLANTNRMGVEITESVRTVAQWAGGEFGRELKKVENDIRWNADTPGALLRFADRIAVPQLSRTMKLVTEGSRMTSNLYEVLDIAAQDTRAHIRMEQNRQRELSTYLAIVIIGFLVYLFVIAIISQAFLDPISELSAQAAASGSAARSAITPAVPADAFRVIFFHSALLQGVGAGLLAGKLTQNSTLSGLKYGIGLVIISTIGFAVILT